MARALPWCGLAVRLLAAAIWLVAGIAKLGDLESFRAQVHTYDLLPGALEAPFAYSLPSVEVGLGLYLTLGLLVRPAAIFGCMLMVIFIAAMAQAWARGLTLDCGCFGSLAREGVGRHARPRRRARPAERRARTPAGEAPLARPRVAPPTRPIRGRRVSGARTRHSAVLMRARERRQASQHSARR